MEPTFTGGLHVMPANAIPEKHAIIMKDKAIVRIFIDSLLL